MGIGLRLVLHSTRSTIVFPLCMFVSISKTRLCKIKGLDEVSNIAPLFILLCR